METPDGKADVEMIHTLFGSRAQTILNALLSFDAYFSWYYPLKRSVPLFCDQELRNERALENCRAAIDLHEILERIAIRNHSSFLPHGAIYKMTNDILLVGDVWAFSLSALELQNAETKRVASTGGSRRLTTFSAGCRIAPCTSRSGPARLTITKGYNSSMSISTLNKLLGAQYLRRGDGIISLRDSKRSQRLFEDGRTKVARGIKNEKLGATYDPVEDTCLKAFIRMCAVNACCEDNTA